MQKGKINPEMVINLHSFQFLIQGINNIQQQFPLSPATAITIDIGLRMFIPSCYLILPLSIPCLYSYTFFYLLSCVSMCVCVQCFSKSCSKCKRKFKIQEVFHIEMNIVNKYSVQPELNGNLFSELRRALTNI